MGRTGWIFGLGCDDALLGRHPTRDDLDKVSNDIPVVAVHISGHFSAMNSAGLAKVGYQLHVHVNGDAGLDMVLDQLELNLRRRPRIDHRTVIMHFAVSCPEQVARIKRLGAIVSGNPYYPVALADNYRGNGLDPERADAMVRMGDVEKAGNSFSHHSDMPMAPASRCS